MILCKHVFAVIFFANSLALFHNSVEVEIKPEYIVFVVVDMIRRRNLRTRAIKMLILDEADEMLNKGNFPPSLS